MAKVYAVGDRVRVYGHMGKISDSELRPYCRGNKGTVTGVTNEECEITVKLDSGQESEVHPKQCRKIKSSAPYEACGQWSEDAEGTIAWIPLDHPKDLRKLVDTWMTMTEVKSTKS